MNTIPEYLYLKVLEHLESRCFSCRVEAISPNIDRDFENRQVIEIVLLNISYNHKGLVDKMVKVELKNTDPFAGTVNSLIFEEPNALVSFYR